MSLVSLMSWRHDVPASIASPYPIGCARHELLHRIHFSPYRPNHDGGDT